MTGPQYVAQGQDLPQVEAVRIAAGAQQAGILMTLVGVLAIVAGVLVGPLASPVHVISLIFMTCFYGGFMGWFLSSRQRRWLENAVPGNPREVSNTRQRLLLTLPGILFAAAVLVLVPRQFPIVAGILLGTGLAMLWTARGVRSWESEHGVLVFRESGVHWREGPPPFTSQPDPGAAR